MKSRILRPPFYTLITILISLLFQNSLHGQRLSVKTNALYLSTASISLGGEVGLGKKTTLDVIWGYNNWEFNGGKKWKHWLVMPEFRYYFCERFNGHFIGVHAGYSQYNFSGIPLLYYRDAKYYRYEGWAVGAGISYGYQWIIAKRWNMEATVGVGVVYTEYGKYMHGRCGAYLGDKNALHIAPTKLGLSFIYMIK